MCSCSSSSSPHGNPVQKPLRGWPCDIRISMEEPQWPTGVWGTQAEIRESSRSGHGRCVRWRGNSYGEAAAAHLGSESLSKVSRGSMDDTVQTNYFIGSCKMMIFLVYYLFCINLLAFFLKSQFFINWSCLPWCTNHTRKTGKTFHPFRLVTDVQNSKLV